MITAGFQVPLIPLLDVVGSAGAGFPAQKGGMELNVGTNIGSDKMTPVNSSVVHPLMPKMKLV